MHTLYTRPQTGGFAVHAVLEETALPYDLVTIEDNTADDFRAISPLGQVPVLGLPDGSTITESAAMCIYLSDLAPGSGISPALTSPLRPHFLRWLAFGSAQIYDADLRYYYAGRHTTDQSTIDGIRAAALADMNRLFAIADTALDGKAWLLGDIFSAADIYIAMLTYWHPDVPVLLTQCANLNRLCEAVKKRPAVARAAEYHDPWSYLD
jgi:glutathione S-transferase